jgi:hypothetical protein
MLFIIVFIYKKFKVDIVIIQTKIIKLLFLNLIKIFLMNTMKKTVNNNLIKNEIQNQKFSNK